MRPITVVTYSSISREAEVTEVKHGDSLVGWNVIFFEPACTKRCEWCEATKRRVRSRANFVSFDEMERLREQHGVIEKAVRKKVKKARRR